MVIKIFSIQDKVTGIFSQPHFVAHKGQMLRMFSDEVNNPESMFSKHPADFSLYYLGEYDDNAGCIAPVAQPEFICCASEFKSK